MRKKVYIVTSLPKTCTTSLCKMAEICNKKSMHTLQNNFLNCLEEGYNFFSDTPFYIPSFLIGLLEGSKNINYNFIYSIRQYDSWKKSFINFKKNWLADPKTSYTFLDYISYNTIDCYANDIQNHYSDILNISKEYHVPMISYDINSGWRDFCLFLNETVPEVAIPHLNKGNYV